MIRVYLTLHDQFIGHFTGTQGPSVCTYLFVHLSFYNTCGTMCRSPLILFLTSLEALSFSPHCPSLSWGHFHSLYYGIPKIYQLLFLSLASIFTSHSPASTEMIFLKCEDIALPCLKLLDRIFQSFHGSLLPDNRTQTLQPRTQGPA